MQFEAVQNETPSTFAEIPLGGVFKTEQGDYYEKMLPWNGYNAFLIHGLNYLKFLENSKVYPVEYQLTMTEEEYENYIAGEKRLLEHLNKQSEEYLNESKF